MRLSAILRCGFFVGFLTVFAFSSNALTATKINVGVSSVNVAFLPLFVAKEKGFFDQEGLETRLVTFKSGTENGQALLSGDVQIGAGAPVEVVVAVDAGAPAKVFWSQSNIMPYQLYSNPEIRSMKEIKGKRFAVSKYGALSDFLTRYAIRNSGFDPEKDTQILQVGSTPARYAALKSKAVDVALLWSPVTTVAAQDGFNMLLDYKEIIPDWTYEVFYAKEDYLKKETETVRKFLIAYRKAIDFLKKNPDESIKILIKYVGLKEKDAKEGYEEYKNAFPLNGRLELKSIEMMIDQSFQGGEINKKYALREIVDDTFIKEYSK